MDSNGLEKLGEYLAAHSTGVPVDFFESAESTNTLALSLLEERLAKSEAAGPFAVAAENQTAGRGRFSRKWISRKGASICISVAVPISAAARAAESFTVRAGTFLCMGLRAEFSSDTLVKWPNDIYSRGGKKICGILSEFRPSRGAGNPHWAILGVGMNFDFSKLDSPLPDDISKICADLKSVSSRRDFTACEAAAQIVKAALKAAAETEKNAADLPKLFAQVDFLRGKPVCVSVGNRTLEGIACGVDASGKLALRTAGGCELIAGGEASLRPSKKM